MSIEDVQKVNRLAQDLLEQGMMSSREDAIKEAQRILNKEIVGKQEVKEDGSAAAKDNLEYYKNIITRTKEYTLQQLNAFKKEIELLSSEVRKLKNEISVLKVVKSVEKTEEDDPKEPVQQKLKAKKNETNQRTGKINPNDVAVDKIFYYGNK
ncbi:hypothetical protein KY343_00500 [Candidatus Woesearchaeota archaeon]|nr:hypothetical protein [Candidatus Woesearchaeota archaeon]